MPLTFQLLTCRNRWRFVAAAVVVLGHANLAGTGTSGLGLGKSAHTMVMVFFVMWSVMIARATMNSRRGALDLIPIRGTRGRGHCCPSDAVRCVGRDLHLLVAGCWLLACVTELKTSKVKSWLTA